MQGSPPAVYVERSPGGAVRVVAPGKQCLHAGGVAASRSCMERALDVGQGWYALVARCQAGP